MPTPTVRLLLAGGGMLLLLAGCNSDLTDNGSTTTQSAVGVWAGTDSVSGEGVTALVTSGGQAVFIRGDGAQFDSASASPPTTSPRASPATRSSRSCSATARTPASGPSAAR